MIENVTTIDRDGRIAIPLSMLDTLGLPPETEVVITLLYDGVLIKPKNISPITDRIAAMSLPVADWEQMETETELGRLR